MEDISNQYTDYVSRYLDEVRFISNAINKEQIVEMALQLRELQQRNGRLFILGIGGSAANASHAVNDFRKIMNLETYAVTDNIAELTARINDDGWETSYSNSLKVSRLCANDAILVFSVSGGTDTASQSIVRAMNLAKEVAAKIYSIVGVNGGHAKTLSDICICIPSSDSKGIVPHAEEWQGVIWHLIVNCIKEVK